MVVDSEFSPELALVCPDLASRARAELPDRPWEVFVPVRGPVERIGPPPRSVAAAGSGYLWVERVSSAFPLVMLAAFVALLIIGSLPGLSKGPTLGPPVVTKPTPPAPPPVSIR
jgi:hypothetical protein